MATEAVIDPEELCALCGRKYGGDELILLEFGQMLPMRKDPRFLRFQADSVLPQKEWAHKVVTHVYHFDCVYALIRLNEISFVSNPSACNCYICGHDFHKDRWAFKLTAGGINLGIFEPDSELPLDGCLGVICSYCTQNMFDDSEFELQMRELADKMIEL